MSVTISRTKGNATHHAVSVDARLSADGNGQQVVTGTGHVSEWNTDPEKAGRFPDAVAQHVARHYNGRLNAGDLVFRDDRGKVLAETEGAEPVAGRGPGPAPKGAAELEAIEALRDERDDFQLQARTLGAENERLRKEAEQQKKYADATAKTNGEQLAEIAELKRRVKELEDAAKKAAK